MLVSKPKARDIRDGRNQLIFLVPELCRATGLTDGMRKDFAQMKAMAEHTQMDPEKRKTRLLTFPKRLHQSVESVTNLEEFHTDITNQLVTFEGRELKQELMIFGDDKTSQNNNRVDWTNAMKSNQMYRSIPLKRWVYIYPQKNANESREFLNLLREVANGMRYDMAEPKTIELPNDRVQTYEKEIKEIMTKDPKMIVIVVPNNTGDRYSVIKKLTCVGRSIPTQIIVSKTMMKKIGKEANLRSIASKVMIQINCKLGGAPWMINFPMSGCMAIGFDVTHDTKDRGMSYGAFVASFDLKKSVKYFSACSAHRSGEEVSANISVHMVSALKAYSLEHGTLPDRIMFYRDGVGDGQIEYVHKMEVQSALTRIGEIYSKHGEGKFPKFSFIIVNKRLNTRIFLNQGSRVSNPMSGTVVDNTITLPER